MVFFASELFRNVFFIYYLNNSLSFFFYKFWKNNQKIHLEKQEYDQLFDFIPSVLSYLETIKTTVCFLTKALQEMNIQKENEALRSFNKIELQFSSKSTIFKNFCKLNVTNLDV